MPTIDLDRFIDDLIDAQENALWDEEGYPSELNDD